MLQRTIFYEIDDARIRSALVAAIVLVTLLAATRAVAETSVFRCITSSGSIEFRQTPCAPASSEKEMTIDNRPIGWTPPKPSEDTGRNKQGRNSRKKRKSSEDTVDPAQERRCWKKRQQLDDVNWQLRRGYKAAQGIKLRRRREDYEDYIDRFCTEK